MRILLDLPHLSAKAHGMQVYTENVLKSLFQLAGPDREFVAQTFGLRGVPQHEERLKLIDPEGRARLNSLPIPQSVYERCLKHDRFGLFSHLYKADLVHSFGWRALPKVKPPVVLTIQDVIPLRLSEGSDEFISWVRATLTNLTARAHAIITISEFSKREIVEILDVDPNLVEVIPDGVDLTHFSPLNEEDKSAAQAVLKRLNIQQPYFLHTGGNQKRKNKLSLIKAFDLFSSRYHLPHQLVLVGSETLDAESTEFLAGAKCRDHVINTGYVCADDAVRLLQQATALIFPSTYEGFGLPPLEAMACGVPTAIANVTALPEVGGDAALYFSPFDWEQISDCMWRLASDDDLRLRCIQSGLGRSASLTWNANAESTLNLYDRVTGHRTLKATTCKPMATNERLSTRFNNGVE